MFAWRVSRPLQDIASAACDIAAGNWTRRVPIRGSGPGRGTPRAAVRGLRARPGAGGAEGALRGPAPVLRLRGRYRAQLVVIAYESGVVTPGAAG